MLSRFKEKVKTNEKDIITAVVIILVAVIGFGLGRFSVIREQKTPIKIENIPAAVGASGSGDSSKSQGDSFVANQGEKLYVASKNSTKYHFPWCSGALRIKEENKIWFSSKEEAEKAGYTPAANCKGL